MRLTDRQIRVGVGLAILALAGCFVALIVTGTVESRAYFRKFGPPLPARPYPMGAVTFSCALLLVEAFVLWRMLIAAWSTLRVRALVACAASFVAALVVGMNLMHAPPRVSYHFLWLLCVTALTLITFLVSAGNLVVERLAHDRGSG